VAYSAMFRSCLQASRQGSSQPSNKGSLISRGLVHRANVRTVPLCTGIESNAVGASGLAVRREQIQRRNGRCVPPASGSLSTAEAFPALRCEPEGTIMASSDVRLEGGRVSHRAELRCWKGAHDGPFVKFG